MQIVHILNINTVSFMTYSASYEAELEKNRSMQMTVTRKNKQKVCYTVRYVNIIYVTLEHKTSHEIYASSG